MDLLVRLSEMRTPWWTTFFSWITHLGDGVLVALVLFVLYWCVDKRLARKIGLAVAFGGLLNGILKASFFVPRPWVRDSSFQAVEAAKARATGYSFPSGHVSNAVCGYGTLAAGAKKWTVRLLFGGLILLVAFSRMYLGVHTPLDVGVSLLVSVAVVWLCVWGEGRLESLSRRGFLRFVLLSCLLALAGALWIRFRTYPDGYDFFLCKDGYVACGMVMGLSLGWYLEKFRLDFSTKGGWLFQLLKAGLGLLTTALLMKGMELAADALPTFREVLYVLKYALLTLWAMFGYPWLFHKRKEGRNA